MYVISHRLMAMLHFQVKSDKIFFSFSCSKCIGRAGAGTYQYNYKEKCYQVSMNTTLQVKLF